MGRITIFSLEDCSHCKRTKAAFDCRSIPYVDINLSKYPEKRNDMLSLSDRLTVPQVFLNETHIGGAEKTIKLLKSWDRDLSPLEYYDSFVRNAKNPVDSRLQPPSYPPKEEFSSPPPVRDKEKIKMPNGKSATCMEVTELLKSILPRKEMSYNLTLYKNSFKGSEAVHAFKKKFEISTEEAIKFGRDLQGHKIMDHVVREHAFTDTDELFFRLQCDQNPNILNSYCVWTEQVDPDSMRLLKRLKTMLNSIISAHTDGTGKVDYKKAATSKDLPAFEEAVCELHGVYLDEMAHATKMAFLINLYNMMIKYAFIKVGIAQSNIERSAFFNKVSFNIGSDIFSFQDLEHGIMRGNRKAPYSLSPQFSRNDPRLKISTKEVDYRIHFALNCGAVSCPPVKNFTKQGIEEELRIVSQAFCEDDSNVRIDTENRTVYLSKIFSWYQEDFGKSNSQLLETLKSCLRGTKEYELKELLFHVRMSSVKIKYVNYDWSTDASDSISFKGDTTKADTSRFL